MEHRHFSLLNLYRAFFAMAVIIWHTRGLGVTEVLNKVENFHISYKDILYFNVFLVAVPLFLQVSLFLYLQNREQKSGYFKKRVFDITLLLVFWSFCCVTFNTVEGFKGLTWTNLPMFILTGGNTFFYFFASLLVVTLITEAVAWTKNQIPRRPFLMIQWALLLVSTLLISFKGQIAPYLGSKALSYFMPFWSPINFIPYIFVAFIIHDLYKNKSHIKTVTFFLMLSAYIGSVIIEWKWANVAVNIKYGYPLPNYERPSVVIISALLLLLAVYRDVKMPKGIEALAGLSLGVFCLHPFVMGHITRIIPYEVIHPRPYLYFIGVYVVCLVLAYIIKRYKVI